ncbi:rRNA maturation RNase YbeY [Kordiimonas sp.]|uniref:rRNA maturation RNase YbeY n=1 Tax=Kordiimonas sp. TaxID=1970157 RepID=UPI003A8EF0D9
MSDDPSPSIIDRETDTELPGLTLDFDLRDGGLGDAGHLAAVIGPAVVAALRASAPKVAAPMDLSVIVTGAEESRTLNREYRDRDKPTNVLSFPATDPDELDDAFRFALAGGPPAMLGDLVLCVPVVLQEAHLQGKPADHHVAHLCVHGVLHLMGHDHIEDTQAEEMEALEREILAGMGIPDPYLADANMDEDDD